MSYNKWISTKKGNFKNGNKYNEEFFHYTYRYTSSNFSVHFFTDGPSDNIKV